MSDERGEGSTQSDDSKPGDEDAAVDLRPGRLEIVATVLSALLVAGILGVLVWDAVHPNMRPAFAVRPGGVEREASEYRVPVSVHNSGDDAAKSVDVHLELMAADSVLAESDLTIDWLPGHTSKELVGLFARPASSPTPTGVHAEVRGYATP